MRVASKWVAWLVAVALVFSSTPGLSGPLFAADKTKAIKYREFLVVSPGEIIGKVLYPDGKTPAATVPVRVWSTSKKKFVFEATTDKKGAYKLPKLATDGYFVVYGDRVSVDLRVEEKAKQTLRWLNVIIPRGKVFFAAERQAGELWGELGLERAALLKSLILIGAGGATAVGIIAATGNLGEETKKIVSP